MNTFFERLNTISVKVIILYAALAVLNIAFFTTIVFENQVDSITDSTKLKAEIVVSKTLATLKKFYTDNRDSGVFRLQNEKKILQQVQALIKPLVGDFIIHKENGTIVYKSDEKLTLHRSSIQDGMKAVADLDFSGKEYYVKIDVKSYMMYFYVPLKKYSLPKLIMYVPYDLKHLDQNLNNLYSQVKIIFIITSLFHIIFAVLLFRIIIKPIQTLRAGSQKIAGGDLNARVELKRNDEIGQLAVSFNEMADSIDEKVTSLVSAKRIADRDMGMAVNVQQNFLINKAPQTEKWDTAFLFKPVSGVSGDFYDFYSIDNELTGAGLFDVSGHGVASGLVTMLSKQIIFRNFNLYKDKKLQEVLDAANAEIIEQIDETGYYLTGIILRLNENTVEYVNAGHADLIVKRKNSVQVVDPGTDFRGRFIGMSVLQEEFKGLKFKINDGDSLLIFSDCLNESTNSEDKMFDEKGVLNSFKNCPDDASAQEIIEHILQDFNNFIKDEPLVDDLTIIVLKRKIQGS